MTRYRTIVADPPWEYPEGFMLGNGKGDLERRALPYESMSVDAIAALPVRTLAAGDCRVFLWTTNRYLPESLGVLEEWGIRYRQTLVWHKTNAHLPGSVAPNSAEFLLVGTRGKPARLGLMPSAVIPTSNMGGFTVKGHSAKPEVWLDRIEQVSPGPYLEMFARRNRLGWDTWGNEALEHVEMGAA